MNISGSTGNIVYSDEEAMLLNSSDDDEHRHDDDSECIGCNDFNNYEEEDVGLGACPIPATLVPTVARSVTPVPTIAYCSRKRQKRDDFVDTEIPQKVTREDAIRMVRKKLQVEKMIGPDYVSDEEKSTIEKVAIFCEIFVSTKYDDTKWDPRTLVYDSGGLYGIEYLSSSRKSKVGITLFRIVIIAESSSKLTVAMLSLLHSFRSECRDTETPEPKDK
jgi:hypothetical protein